MLLKFFGGCTGLNRASALSQLISLFGYQLISFLEKESSL